MRELLKLLLTPDTAYYSKLVMIPAEGKEEGRGVCLLDALMQLVHNYGELQSLYASAAIRISNGRPIAGMRCRYSDSA